MEQQDEEEQQQPPPPPPPAPPSVFDRQLACLQADELASFDFRDTSDHRSRRWTTQQALDVSSALVSSTVIENLTVRLAYYRPEALGLTEKYPYLRSIPSLKHLVLEYDPVFLGRRRHSDSLQLRQVYEQQFDKLFGAVLQNPSIETLETNCLGSKEAILDLLSNTTSLKKFVLSLGTRCRLHGTTSRETDIDTVLHAAAGFRLNSSLTQVELRILGHDSSGSLGKLISGLNRNSSLEDLTVEYEKHSDQSNISRAVTDLLRFSTTLRKLKLQPETYFSASTDENYEEMLMTLFRPSLCQIAGAGLKELHLHAMCIDLGGENIRKASSSANGFVNNTLEILTLECGEFASPSAVKVLWQLAGLRTLKIDRVSMGDDDDIANGKLYASAWKEIIVRNPKLEKVSTFEVDPNVVDGIWKGACGHENLESLVEVMKYEGLIDESRGALLRCLLQQTHTVKRLSFGCGFLDSSGGTLEASAAHQLASGVADSNTLESLSFVQMLVEDSSATAILRSLVVNNKLKYLYLDWSWLDFTTEECVDFKAALLAVVRVNTTLLSLHLPWHIVFRGNDMTELFNGFGANCPLRTLNFSRCEVHPSGLVAMGRGLGRDNVVVDNVMLPHIESVGESEQDVKTCLKTFIGTLKRIEQRRFKVTFAYGNVKDREVLELVLQALKENKNLVLDVGRSDHGNAANADLLAEIEFELKLNCFGRCLFGSTTLPSGLWPTILAPMATSTATGDSAALFCFVREFFCSPWNPHHVSQELMLDESRPSKRARLEAGK